MPIFNRSYTCRGSELHLSDCPSFEPNRTEPCGYRRNAYIVCQGESRLTKEFDLKHIRFVFVCKTADPLTPVGNCVTGEVRLEDGPNVREGRVEICINNAWGTVCNDQFGIEDAVVTCTQMKFSDEGKLIASGRASNEKLLCLQELKLSVIHHFKAHPIAPSFSQD